MSNASGDTVCCDTKSEPAQKAGAVGSNTVMVKMKRLSVRNQEGNHLKSISLVKKYFPRTELEPSV